MFDWLVGMKNRSVLHDDATAYMLVGVAVHGHFETNIFKFQKGPHFLQNYSI